MIRQGFVSNSSSSSFIILKERLSPVQISMIKNHVEVCKTLEVEGFEGMDWTDAWSINEGESYISGNVSMDNFDMYDFLKDVIAIEMKYVHWEDQYLIDEEYIRNLKEQDRLTTLELRKNKLDEINGIL